MDYKSLELKISDHVAEVMLKGPGKGNAMGPDFFAEMVTAFDELDGDDQVRAVIIHGSGKNFTYGLDLMAMMAELGPLVLGPQMAKGRTKLHDLIGQLQGATDRVEACRKPVIVAMHGWCIGGGLDLAAACDIRLCTQDTQFSLREVKVAMVADLGSLARLPRIIGQGATREMAFTGRDVPADEALVMGLVTRVLPDHDALLDVARQTAAAITENPPLVVQGIKQVLNFNDGKSVQDGLDYVAVWNAAFLQSQDLAEAFTSFTEKRAPQFKGE